MPRHGAFSLHADADGAETDPGFERMVSIQEQVTGQGFRLECLKLAVSAKAHGEPGDTISLANRFVDFVVGKTAE